MNTIVVEKENKVKSGVSTTVIVISIILILWLYKMNIKMPVPFPKAAETEVAIELPTSSSHGEKSINETSIPVVAQKSQNIKGALDEQASRQNKTPEVISEKLIDNSIESMQRNREKARQQAKKPQVHGNDNGQSKGDDGYTGYSRPTETIGPGISSTFSGRSFLGGNTSIDCHEAGKVILEVEVLPNGKIIFIDVDPATNGSDCLLKAAREILKNSSFNESIKPRSNGTVTFIFKLN
jgi:hypothetical protein